MVNDTVMDFYDKRLTRIVAYIQNGGHQLEVDRKVLKSQIIYMIATKFQQLGMSYMSFTGSTSQLVYMAGSLLFMQVGDLHIGLFNVIR